jgi:hypothetical protein
LLRVHAENRRTGLHEKSITRAGPEGIPAAVVSPQTVMAVW